MRESDLDPNELVLDKATKKDLMEAIDRFLGDTKNYYDTMIYAMMVLPTSRMCPGPCQVATTTRSFFQILDLSARGLSSPRTRN